MDQFISDNTGPHDLIKRPLSFKTARARSSSVSTIDRSNYHNDNHNINEVGIIIEEIYQIDKNNKTGESNESNEINETGKTNQSIGHYQVESNSSYFGIDNYQIAPDILLYMILVIPEIIIGINYRNNGNIPFLLLFQAAYNIVSLISLYIAYFIIKNDYRGTNMLFISILIGNIILLIVNSTIFFMSENINIELIDYFTMFIILIFQYSIILYRFASWMLYN